MTSPNYRHPWTGAKAENIAKTEAVLARFSETIRSIQEHFPPTCRRCLRLWLQHVWGNLRWRRFRS